MAIVDDMLPKATFVSLQPLEPKFFQFKDFRAVLERAMGSRYATLMKGSCISINHFGDTYRINVKDVMPEDVCSIVNTDVEVDLVPPTDENGTPLVIPAGSSAEKDFGTQGTSIPPPPIAISITDPGPALVTIARNPALHPVRVSFVAPSNMALRVSVEVAIPRNTSRDTTTSGGQSSSSNSNSSSAPAADALLAEDDIEVYLSMDDEGSASINGRFPSRMKHSFTCTRGEYVGAADIVIPPQAADKETKSVILNT